MNSTLTSDIEWFAKLLDTRFNAFLNTKNNFNIHSYPVPPIVKNDNSVYANFINHYQFTIIERLAIILAIMPHLKPELLDIFYLVNTKTARNHTEFGGVISQNHSGFMPTGETLFFICGNKFIENKIEILNLFDASHIFSLHTILVLENVPDNEPILSGALQLSPDFTELFILGQSKKPNFSARFPARLITTKLNLSDLIVESNVIDEINDILLWIKHKSKILIDWQLDKTIKPGYRALFYGPPGTGKTFAASLLGKLSGKDVYKIDLSMIVSKWVGETEKNLARVFDLAENKDWILFFDEADALFGKRSGNQSGQDRYANQEVAYLLQRTEDFPGTVILASNLKGNMDEAFTRRFQSIIYFALPKPNLRLKIWENYFKQSFNLDADINLKKIANDYEIAGGGIVNVLKYCAIKAADRNKNLIVSSDLTEGIRRELLKEGKMA